VSFNRIRESICIFMLAGVAVGTVYAADRSIVAIPDVKLNPKIEGIGSVSLTVYCGHIFAIGEIPLNWTVSLGRTISTGPDSDPPHEELSLIANSDASAVPALDEIRHAVKIRDVDNSCFDGSISVEVWGMDRDPATGKGIRMVKFPLRQVKLLPEH